MTTRPTNQTDFLNKNAPNMARIFDYLAGGTTHYAIDRQIAAQLLKIAPSLRKWVRLRHTFLHEAARQLYQQGFRQFLDLASGIPSTDHIHAHLPEAKIVYSDINPVAVSYGHSLFLTNDRVNYIEADARDFLSLVQHPDTTALIDPTQKVAIGLNSLLLFLQPDDIRPLITTIHDWAPAGSRIFIVLQTRATNIKSPEYAQVQALSAQAGLPMNLYSLKENLALLQPWQPTILEPIVDFLGLPSDMITSEDRTEVKLSFYAAILDKQATAV